MAKMEDGFAGTRRFGRLHFKAGGAGAPLLLTSSNGCSCYEYQHVWDALSDRYRFIAWDLPGQGDSDPLTRHLSIDDYADAIAETLDDLEIERAHIGGSSIGVPLAHSFARRHPERALSAIFIDGMFQNGDAWLPNWPLLENIFTQLVQTKEDIAGRFNVEVTPELLTRWNIDRVKAGRNMMSALWAYREYDMVSLTHGMTLPALILFGAKGPCMPCLDAFSKALPQAKVTVLKNCGHFPMIDDPEGFTKTIIDFIG
jgi:pimeloyl-ACP methyl ester carboxylesterase